MLRCSSYTANASFAAARHASIHRATSSSLQSGCKEMKTFRLRMSSVRGHMSGDAQTNLAQFLLKPLANAAQVA